MGSGGSKKKDEKTSSPSKSSSNNTTVNYTNNQSDSRNQQERNRSQHQHEHSENNNVSKSYSDSRKRQNDSADNNIDDSDTDSWYDNKTSTKVISTGRQTKEMNEYNRQKSVDTKRQTHEEDYPETYAQRNLRALYRKENLLRQKTIYRDPDEWDGTKQEEHAQEDDTSNAFDVSKFKEANKPTQIKRDIFGDLPDYTQRNQLMEGDPDSYYYRNESSHSKAEPKYDITEEELMADIDREFN